MSGQTMILEDGSGLLLVHFLFRSAPGTLRLLGMPLGPGESTLKIACVPNLLEMHALASRPFPWQRTDDWRAVTCPLCKSTEEFQKAHDQPLGVPRS